MYLLIVAVNNFINYFFLQKYNKIFIISFEKRSIENKDDKTSINTSKKIFFSLQF